MKKLLVILLTVCALMSVVACGDKTPPPTDSSDNSEQSNNVVLNAFENNKDLDTILLKGVLGKIQVNTDKKYVKEGNGSAKVTVVSDPYKLGAPFIHQGANLTNKGLDYSDFASINYATVEVYNAQSEDRRIALQVAYGDNVSAKEWFDLKPGWNTVRYSINRGLIPTSEGNDGNKARIVKGINVVFERPQKGDADDVFYLDNMRLYKTNIAAEETVINLKANEILSFDEKWQIGMLNFGAWMAQDILPEVAFNSSFAGRGGVLEMTAPMGFGNYAITQHYAGFEVNKELLAKVDWSAYDENAVFAFDYYTPEDCSFKNIWIEFKYSGGRYFQKGINLTPGKWQTVSFTVKELNEGTYGIKDAFSLTTEFILTYGEESDAGRVLYLDNFRMELN